MKDAFENFKKKIPLLRQAEDWKYTSLNRLLDFEPKQNTSGTSYKDPLNTPTRAGYEQIKEQILQRLGMSANRSQWNVISFADGLQIESDLSEKIRIQDIQTPEKSNQAEHAEQVANTGINHTLNGSIEELRSQIFQTKTLVNIEGTGHKIVLLNIRGLAPQVNLTGLCLEIKLAPCAQADMIQVNVDLSEKPSLHLDSNTYLIDRTAKLTLLDIQESGSSSTLLAGTKARVQSNGRFDHFLCSLSRGLVRNDISSQLCEEGAETSLNGFYGPTEKGHIANYTAIFHDKSHTSSSQLYKGLVHDSAHAVFNGKVCIRKGADGSSAHQLNRSILLSDAARVDTKPELQIDADEVTCSHGATVGPLAPEEIFYLQSRALTQAQATSLMCKGFVLEIAENCSSKEIKDAYGFWLSDFVFRSANGSELKAETKSRVPGND